MFPRERLSIWCCLGVLAGINWLGIPAAQGQGDTSEVHIQPRGQMSPVNSAIGDGLNLHAQQIRKSVELVLVPVTLTDDLGRVVTGLGQDNFKVFEGKQQQEIKHFSLEDSPVSLGVILDLSSSMDSKIDRAREAVVEMLKSSNPQDEFFLITFADAPHVTQDFTQKIENMQEKLLFARPKGRTSLLDAIYSGIQKMKEAKYQKKALLVISDGGDNHSLYTENEVKSMVKEADVLIYSVGVFDHDCGITPEDHLPGHSRIGVDSNCLTTEERLGPALLREISDVTGGRSYTLDNPNDLPQITEHIGYVLRNQYVLGYRPTCKTDDGKWRKIKVKLASLPKGLRPLRVVSKTGYYAPSR
jgi:Ca-activated chloride channel family protein